MQCLGSRTVWFVRCLRLRIGHWVIVLRYPVGAREFPFQKSVQTDCGYRGLFLREVKRPGREADHSPPSSAEVKNVQKR